MSEQKKERERPTRHGKILGDALALIAMAGRKDAPMELPEMCVTCAFREGCMTNQMASTGITALNCVLGIDQDRFACHHGLKEGNPQRLCVGYVAARLAPYSFTRKVLETLKKDLDAAHDGSPDQVRAAFDAWLAKIDPDNKMDDYTRARVYGGHLRASAGGDQAS